MFDKPTLIITHSFPLSTEDYRGRFIDELLLRGGDAVPVVVLTPDPNGAGVDVIGPVTIHRFRWPHGYLAGRRIYNPFDLLVFLRMLLIFVIKATKIVNAYQIQHVFACWAIPGGLAAFFVRVFTGVPYTVWALGTDISKFKNIPILLRAIFHFATGVYANSEFLRGEMRGLTGQPIDILPTRSRLPEPVMPQNPIEVPEKMLVVAFVGRLERVKGIDIFIDIARQVKKERPDMLFVVFGDGSLKESVTAAEKEGLVRWAGQVSPGELAYYARRIDVLCITSREESMPVVVWEFRDYCRILSFNVGDVARHVPSDAIMDDEEALVQRLMKMQKNRQ
ncbi:MAG TPA: glycosyltransferase [bacterium]|nr:glycosyltransferase [bacterium]